MLIKSSIASNKTSYLIKEYVNLLNHGVSAREILVLVQNSHLKRRFLEQVLDKTTVCVLEKPEIHTFYGLVYNTVIDNWAIVENNLNDAKTKFLPNMIGLELSQFVMKDIMKKIDVSGYNSKMSLLHQLFRRYGLIVQNHLNDKAVDWRSKIVLKESFGEDAKKILRRFYAKTLEYRSFDYLRQAQVFNFIQSKTNCFKDIKYLIIDDADEMTPVCFDFVSSLKPQLIDFWIAFDEKGSSRSGYLSADKNVPYEIEQTFGGEQIQLEDETQLKNDAWNIYSKSKSKLKHFSIVSPSKRATMLDLALKKINSLLKSGVKPSEIAVVTPIIDDMLRFCFKQNIPANLANVRFLSGSEKMIQNSLILSCLNILKLNTDLKNSLSEFDLRIILNNILRIPVKACETVLTRFKKDKTLPQFNFGVKDYNENYNKFLNLLYELKNSQEPLSVQVLKIYETIIEVFEFNENELIKFNFFVKQLQDFEQVFDKNQMITRKEDILTQIENSIISENPNVQRELTPNDLVVSTFQKLIDNQIRTKYQFWLDVSSEEWIKSDIGPLYNAWVFQSSWSKKDYTLKDDIALKNEKTSRILRKLTLLAKEEIFVYSSLFDGNGAENFGGIESYFITEQIKNNENSSKFEPRDDQKPILKYESGKMAISAVPGAGKTTILLALILKLLDSGVNASKIYVLTYMESAARNFRERIKNIYEDSVSMPNISTIHGLALKILKENSNYARLNLSEDFDICDDTQRSRIIKTVANKTKISSSLEDKFNRAISIFKLGLGVLNKNPIDKDMKKFNLFYSEYQNLLAQNNLIDYDDILLSAVRLLEENKDILEYYQENCKYIIEDEAQDSSAIQQRLIELLSGKHKNLIRCGDVNQAITTTFSNADVEGFRRFINESNSVEMDCSQRCCEDVWSLANKLVQTDSIDAFYKIYMKPVKNKNPISKNAINYEVLDNFKDEKNYILAKIRKIFEKNPNATVGILLRNNYQVKKWLDLLNETGFRGISRSECLEQKTVFKHIFAILNIILNPFDNKNLAKNYAILADLGVYNSRQQNELARFNVPFMSVDVDRIENEDLSKFYWDVMYWLSFSHLQIDEMVLKIGLSYYYSDIEKSNVYLIATLFKRVSGNFETVMQKIESLAKKPTLSGFKFFSEDSENDKALLEGQVQVMTYHKSKGDEFDYVFLPEMIEDNLPLTIESQKLKADTTFTESIRELNPQYKHKSDEELKQIAVSENLRLLYVAITRAKKGLCFTTHNKNYSQGKYIEKNKSRVFNLLERGTLC